MKVVDTVSTQTKTTNETDNPHTTTKDKKWKTERYMKYKNNDNF